MADSSEDSPKEEKADVRGQGDTEEACQEDGTDQAANCLPAQQLPQEASKDAHRDCGKDVQTG